MKKRNQGFTLVEIMIVVAIIAILAAVAIPNFVKYRQNSQAAACVSNLKQIEAAVEQARMAGGKPSSIEELVGENGYIKNKPVCPAGGKYSLGDEKTSPSCDKGQVDPKDKSSWHMLIKGEANQQG